ncbi:hypothetical protein [Streptomyces sp. BR123]|uniref:hypothetical protein n=1 Tax=Streptomyces sp. BR123 TaxID=2749828 RepID=UPI0027BAB618|nr:hypothetical protein [Streptomyces sp. BR123]
MTGPFGVSQPITSRHLKVLTRDRPGRLRAARHPGAATRSCPRPRPSCPPCCRPRSPRPPGGGTG